MAPVGFDIKTWRRGDACILSLSGELDVDTVPRLEEALRVVEAERSVNLVLDLRGLSFLDSSGLRIILGTAGGRSSNDAPFQLVPGPRAVQRVFELTGTVESLSWADAQDWEPEPEAFPS